MDFSFTDEQIVLRDLAERVFRDGCTEERLRHPEADGISTPLWEALAQAGLLGACLPLEGGGSGLGWTEQALLLEQVGMSAAPVPLWAFLNLGAVPWMWWGGRPGLERLEKMASGRYLATAALAEAGNAELLYPRATVTRSNGSLILNGIKDGVPAFTRADEVLVLASWEEEVAVLSLPVKRKGIRWERQTGTNGEALGRLHLDGVDVPPEGLLLWGEGARRKVQDWLDRVWLGQAALALGLCQKAVELTARYTAERRQFDRPIATFQAVSQRVADAWIDVESIRVAVWRAAWLLDRGELARREVAVARWLAAEAGHRVVNAAQHLHGGTGFDRDYPLYRYYLSLKQMEFTLGSAPRHLARLGDMLAEGT